MRLGLPVTVLLCAAWIGCAPRQAHVPAPVSVPADSTPTFGPALQRALGDPAWPDALRAFYAARELQPVFVVRGTPRPDARVLLDTIAALDADGLPPAQGSHRARALLAAVPHADSLAELELLLTTLWIDAARGLSGGRLAPERVDSSWSVNPPVPDLWATLDGAARADQLVQALTSLRPAHDGYARLRDALARYRSGANGTPEPDRVRQLAVNLERWRWLPRRLEAPYLMVNIPAFELQVMDSGGAVASSRVILGRTDWQTPLVHSSVTHIVLAPPWRVPQEITRRELLPLIRSDTSYLRRHGFDVYRPGAPGPVDPATVDWTLPDSVQDVRLVQRPGPANPLGRVKLVFANQFAIALHDTPAPELFAAKDRALSHGCVRVESALELAARLLGGTAWDEKRLTAVADSGSTRWIALPRPVPVYVTYFTAWVDPDGVLQLRDDRYGWDARLAAALGM